MSCSCDYCCPAKPNPCDLCPNPCQDSSSYYTGCCPPNRTVQIPIDPIFPANDGYFKKPAKSSRPIKKSLAHSKAVTKKKKVYKDPLKSKSFESHHSLGGACSKSAEDFCETNKFEAQESFCSNASSKMAERSLSNFMYDNQELKDAEYKKMSACHEILDCLGPNSETWILQCPKGFDPKSIVSTALGKLSKEKGVECSANKFNEGLSLACLTPEKATEYESVCDNVRILRPVGKIFITESRIGTRRSKISLHGAAADACSENEIEECSDDDVGGVEACPSAASKTIKKKINDQRFTIETTVTVENCAASGDRKKGRKSKISSQESYEECVPTCPPEPIPMKKKKKSKNDSLGWQD